jgi:glycosyltransferase involved in cell wall biosynthesis
MTTSVVIPLFNGRAWIAETLESILGQTRPPGEVIVVDDGSTDQSVEIVQRHSSVRLLHNPGKGTNAARRLGFEHAQHPLVAMVDQDDLWHRDHLALLTPLLEHASETPAAMASVAPFTAGTAPDYSTRGRGVESLDLWSVFPVNVVSTPAQVLFRRQLLADLGGWDTRFRGMGDWHAWLTLSARRPFAKVPDKTVGHRIHANAHGTALRRRNRWEYCDRYLSAAQDRVSLRLRYHPSDAAQVRSRLKLARHLFAWRFADAMLSPRQSTPLAIQVDKLFGDEPLESQQMLLDQVFAFFPIDERPTRLRNAMGFIRLWQRCPREARRLRTALRQYLQRRVSGAVPAIDEYV